MTEAQSPLLVADHIGFRYGSATVLNDVTFTVERGQIAALIGRNGAGKTTLLRCLAGWARTYGGEVRVDGRPVFRAERTAREKLVFVPDTPTFYDELTAWEHLHFIARLNRVADWQTHAEALLRRLALWAQRDALPFTFSRGMRYKLALAMALLVAPPLLLLDEPFGPLDPEASLQLWAQLQACRDDGMGILLSSHGLPTGARPDLYLVLEQGALIAQDTPDALGVPPEGLPLEHLLSTALARAAALPMAAAPAELGVDDVD